LVESMKTVAGEAEVPFTMQVLKVAFGTTLAPRFVTHVPATLKLPPEETAVSEGAPSEPHWPNNGTVEKHVRARIAKATLSCGGFVS
jgi:hypothetical protein